MIRTLIFFLFIVVMIVTLAAALRSGSFSPTANQTASNSATVGKRTKTAGCQAMDALPDSACTPGAINPALTKDTLCSPSFTTKSIRNVPTSEKDTVYAEYGILSHRAGEYEVDHLISLDLGGSNDIANLWPEAAVPKPGYHEKDTIEKYLHMQVCSGRKSLANAQQ